MKTNLLLFALCALCLFLASCSAPPAAVAAAITAAGASVVGIVQAIEPLLSPEQVAKLHATASSIDGGIEATKLALSAVADVITQLKGNTAAQMAQHVEALNKTAAAVAELPSREEVLWTGAGAAAGGTGASRVLSGLKHGFFGKAA